MILTHSKEDREGGSYTKRWNRIRKKNRKKKKSLPAAKTHNISAFGNERSCSMEIETDRHGFTTKRACWFEAYLGVLSAKTEALHHPD